MFVIFVLGFIYLSQTVFLDGFYRRSKIKQIKEVGNEIALDLKNHDAEDLVDKITLSGEVCVRIVSNEPYYNSSGACVLRNLDTGTINDIAGDVIDSGGEKTFDNFKYAANLSAGLTDIYIYGKIININNADIMILVSSVVTPINATIDTIENQYGIIIVVVVIAAILMGLIISRLFVKPLSQIERQSHNLATGKYDGTSIKTRNLELQALNSTLQDANEDILKADKAKKELLGNVSHDLKTPLTMIVGYAEMIKDYPEENNSKNLDIIISEAKRLSTLVDDLIDVSRLESDKIELNKESVNLYKLLSEVSNQYKTYCSSRGIKFKLNATKKEYGNVVVNIDEHRIKQVIYNFINNAINYNDSADKKIELGIEKIDDAYRVYVYDNGQGIDEKDMDNIWDRYYKVDKQHKRQAVGSGIGLAICKNLLEAHELNYGVNSKIGEYTKFYFDLKDGNYEVNP